MPANRSSFTKRQKEHTRQEKRREKEERKKQRALDKQTQGPEGAVDSADAPADTGDGQLPDMHGNPLLKNDAEQITPRKTE